MTDGAAWIRVAEGAIGILSIYLGYRLFCDIPAEPRRVFTSIVSGALLGLFGLVSLAAATANHRPRAAAIGVHGTTKSLRAPGIHRYQRRAERTA
ncbi:MAG TPA: hypothetical protein VEF06_03645 [Bryobacteraceae bacterium]|nr:hypothetical protein [Bryobacteraceae bacterium]